MKSTTTQLLDPSAAPLASVPVRGHAFFRSRLPGAGDSRILWPYDQAVCPGLSRAVAEDPVRPLLFPSGV